MLRFWGSEFWNESYGLKSKTQQVCLPFWRLLRACVLTFSSFSRLLHSLAHGPMSLHPLLLLSQFLSLTQTLLPPLNKDPSDYLGAIK